MRYLRKYNESISVASSEDEIRNLLELELEDIPYAEGFEIKTIDVYTAVKGDRILGFSIALIEDFRNHAGVMQVFKHDERTGTENTKSNHIRRTRQVEAGKIVSDINKKIFGKLARKYDFIIEDWDAQNLYDYIPFEGSADFEVSFVIIPNESVNESTQQIESITSDDIKRIVELNLEGANFEIEEIDVSNQSSWSDTSPKFRIMIQEDFQNNEEISKLYDIVSRRTFKTVKAYSDSKVDNDKAIETSNEIVSTINNNIFNKMSRKYDFKITYMSCNLFHSFTSSDTIREEGDEKIIFDVILEIVLKQPIDISNYK